MVIRVGVVGAGWVARERHIPAFKRDPRARLIAIADHSPERAQTIAKKHGIPFHSGNPADLFGRVDAVSICAPPWAHAELAIAALRSGCHVLVEKPMATTLQDAAAMADASTAAARFLCVSHNFLFSRSARRAFRLMAGGAIGEPRAVIGCQLSSWRRRIPDWHHRLPGGLFFDEAPHMLYLTRALLGDLRVLSARVGEHDARFSHVHTSLQGDRGVEAQIDIFTGTPISEWVLTVLGAEGMLVIDLFRDVTVHLRADGSHRPRDVLVTSMRAVAQHLTGITASGALLMRGSLHYGHDHLVRRFITAVRGEGPLPVTATDGVAVVRILESILAASQRREVGRI